MGKMHSSFESGVGVVIFSEVWKDPGAPDRNCGVHVHVLWSDGNVKVYEDDELTLIGEKQYENN